MKANVQPLEANSVKLTVELEDAELDAAIDEAFKKLARQVNIPGFRPGKAPRRLVEQRVGTEAARAQALQDSLPDFYMRAIEEQDIDPIAAPKLEITSGEEEGPVVFEAEIETRPVPQIPGYEGLEVTIPNPTPTEEEIDEYVERMRKQYGELEPVERAAKEGDFVTLDIKGTANGEPVAGLNANDYSYEVGATLQSLGPDFDDQVNGSKAGDTKTFTSVVPPNDDEVDFEITIKEVNERKLPELNDEWANEVSEFETLKELRADIAGRLEEARKSGVAQKIRDGAIEAIAQLVEDDIPEVLITSEMDRQIRELQYRLQSQGADFGQLLSMTGQNAEQFMERLREGATSTVRADLALRSLAAKQNIEVSDQEVDDEVELVARQLGQKTSKVRRDLERANQIPAVRSDIRKAKALEWLTENVQLVDGDGKSIDRKALGLDGDGQEDAQEIEGEA